MDGQAMPQHDYGIYIHWPYCLKKCNYCNFNSYENANAPVEDLFDAILRQYEIEREHFVDSHLVSVYFGGGTPSLMAPEAVERLLARISDDAGLDGVEVSLEANPGTVTPEKLKAFRQAGVNRLSLGVQSFQDEILKYLGRIHDSKQAYLAIENALEAGFDNWGLDLILGTSLSTERSLKKDLEILISFAPKFVSAYMLSIEEGTDFGKRHKKGEKLSLGEDEVSKQYEITSESLENIGMLQYEISNYALPGFHSRNNCLYWHGDEYLGLGPGAHGFRYLNRYERGVRNECQPVPENYIKSISTYSNYLENSEAIDQEMLSREFIFCRLRLAEGLDLLEYEKRFGKDLVKTFKNEVASLESRGLVEIIVESDRKYLRLTKLGRLFADEITVKFF